MRSQFRTQSIVWIGSSRWSGPYCSVSFPALIGLGWFLPRRSRSTFILGWPAHQANLHERLQINRYRLALPYCSGRVAVFCYARFCMAYIVHLKLSTASWTPRVPVVSLGLLRRVQQKTVECSEQSRQERHVDAWQPILAENVADLGGLVVYDKSRASFTPGVYKTSGYLSDTNIWISFCKIWSFITSITQLLFLACSVSHCRPR